MIDRWDKMLDGERDYWSAHLSDEFGGCEMDWKQGDEAQWMRAARKGWYDYHYLKCLVIVPGAKRVGIAIQNTATGEWEPRWVAVSRLVR